MKRILPSLLFSLVTFCGHAADPVAVAALGTASPLKFADAMTIRTDGELLRVAAPSFWKCGWQVQRPALPVMDSSAAKPLTIQAEGSSRNEKLVLRLRFVSSDWSRADIYEIPLTSLADGDLRTYSSTTAFGEPAEKENGGLSAGETSGAVQFLFKGAGNAPVELAFGNLGME